jgi:hypothetical protein
MKDFVQYEEALELKQLGFNEPCLGWFASDRTLVKEVTEKTDFTLAPTYSQTISFLYIYSNKQIDISIKGSDTDEERVRKIRQGCKDLRDLQNSKSY